MCPLFNLSTSTCIFEFILQLNELFILSPITMHNIIKLMKFCSEGWTHKIFPVILLLNALCLKNTDKILLLNLNQNWLGFSKTGELNFSEKIYVKKPSEHHQLKICENYYLLNYGKPRQRKNQSSTSNILLKYFYWRLL